ncbi:Histidine kinase [Chitinophaga jiangningensis]|uniref:Histidine kinase n=1 Tax=Chitinophaga jiangningensis TaxID=1419482 RepID=A0A1M6XTW9_9BACT|nr:histidine kinase [Chitinophaga jiangningensis]SHL09431.1 Histidine kinase [Chitinophaga jiangningensis]
MKLSSVLLLRLLKNRVCQHILFWDISYYYLLVFFSAESPQKIDLIYTTVFHLPLVTGVYINLDILIPRLLRRQQYFVYAISVVALIALTAGFNMLLFNKVVDYIFPGYFFISYYSFTELVQFAVIYVGLTTLLKLSRGWFQLMESENRLMRLQSEKADTELLYLKSQINPHFLFNTLNSIYSLSLRKDDKVPPTLLKLAAVMRYMIYESNDALVLLESEINYLRDYIALHQVRNAGKADIRFEVNGDAGKSRVAPFMFIVFVENGFKHGVEAGMNDTFLHVRMDITGRDLYLSVKNNKGLVDETENDAHKGLGLQNVKRRLDMLYPGRHQLVIQEDDVTYAVTLQLQLHDHQNQPS